MNRLRSVSQRTRTSGKIVTDSHRSNEEQCACKASAKVCNLCRRISNWRAASSAAAVALACLFLLSACSSVQVHLGMKVALEKIPVQSISASLLQGPGLGPGQKGQVVVVVTQADGKVLQTKGVNGKVLWKDLTITATIVSAKKNGVVKLPGDPRVSDGKVPHVTITVPSHPDVRAELDIPVRYDEKYAANFSGSAGSSGMNGTDGMDGSSGSTGSMDPTNPSPGGNGTDGTDGSNGQDGDPGGNAPPVQVRTTVRAGTHPLLQVGVSAAGKQKFYLVDPQGGSLTVSADGGSGGSGGIGGRGGRGGSGGMGTPSGSSGRDGSDGRSGFDGTRGSGGRITVTYDPLAKPYLSVIHLSSQNGPAPVFKEEPVAALW